MPEPTYEPYRPPPILSHERTNPFDKNKTPTYDNKTSGIYSSLPSNTSAPTPPVIVKDEKKEVVVIDAPFKPVSAVTFGSTSGFDYSYRPPPLPIFSSKDSVERQDSKPSEPPTVEKSETSQRHKFERKLSDADIIFGSKPEPYTSSFKVETYSRNRSNSSFTSTSTDSDYVYGSRENRKDNPFQKSLSVSSEKDGDFAHDPSVVDTRAFQGISNDGFTDYDTPKSTTTQRSWSHQIDDDDDDLK